MMIPTVPPSIREALVNEKKVICAWHLVASLYFHSSGIWKELSTMENRYIMPKTEAANMIVAHQNISESAYLV